MSTGRRQNPTNVNDLPRPPAVDYDAIFQNIQGNTNQIPGIASNIRNIGGDTDRIIEQNLGLGRGLTNVGSAVTDLKDLELGKGQTGIAQQLTDQDALLRNTINPNIRGLYSDRATASGIGTNISNQTTTLSDLIKRQIGDVTANQALQDTSLKSILGNVGEGGTLATQLATRAGAIDKGIEGLQKTGDTAAKSLSNLIGGQTRLGGSIGGLATDFGDFSKQYTDDQAQAELFRTDARDSIIGGQQRIQEAMGGNLGQRIDQVARNVDRQRTEQQQDFAGVARLISRNVPADTRPGSNDLVERAQFREALDKARFALQNNRFKDQNTANTYSALVNSFDADGKLLRSVRDGENIIARSFEGENLMIDAVNSVGQDIGGISLNVNDLLNNLSGNIAQQQQQQLPAAPIGQVSNDSERFNRRIQGLGAPQV